MKRILSLGAGVQSSALALMASVGAITPKPELAVFADTQWESSEVYGWLDWLETELTFPVVRVTKPGLNLGQVAIGVALGKIPRKGASLPPLYLDRPFGALPLQCSKVFKTRVIQQYYRTHVLHLAKGERVKQGVYLEQWLGISKDEAHRQKDCELKYIQNRYPLIESNLTRSDCLQWMEAQGYPTPPRSSCIFCPFRSDKEWTHLKTTLPDDFNRAVEFDKQIRNGYPGMRGEAFIHGRRKPLDQIEFRHQDQPNLFGNECEGMCGV